MPRKLPSPTPETLHFWQGCQAGELRLQRCVACRETYFPPRPFCPRCASREVEVYAASGRARLYSYVINHRPRPDMGTEPYAIAVVELAEGPRLMTNIVNCPQTPEALELDMPLQVHFQRESDEITLPLFEPARSQGA
ncbi:MAG TPA: OB-fold domain-containing protein [Sphingobium sp.]|nr:OB-fold domain-containing protein [Sphingobium sp.]